MNVHVLIERHLPFERQGDSQGGAILIPAAADVSDIVVTGHFGALAIAVIMFVKPVIGAVLVAIGDVESNQDTTSA